MPFFVKNITNNPKRVLIADIISALLLLLLLYTAISKLVDHENFRVVLNASPLLRPFAEFVAWGLPMIELMVALLLFIPSKRRAGLLAALVLLIALTCYLIYMVLFTPNLPCNCGGVLKNLSWGQHIIFNSFFILISVIGITITMKNPLWQDKSPP